MSTARTNHVAVAACDRAGVERGQRWTEGTAIVSADGWVAAEAGPGERTVMADLDLSLSRDKMLTEYVHLLDDRRLDLY
jgi:predicted amidohydrolase